MRPDDPTSELVGDVRIVAGVQGSRRDERALEFASKKAARWDSRLQVVSAQQETPTEGGLDIPVSIVHEQAEAITSDALRRHEELAPAVVVEGEDAAGTCGHRQLTLLRSVSEHVLHHATFTTIAVR